MTQNSNPTKGLWRVGDAGHTVFGPKRTDGSAPQRIAELCNTGEFHANGRLIAAAPEMLATLQRWADWYCQGSHPEVQGVACDTFTAIAKALGKPL